jgi:HEAT repeat protein
VERAHLAAIVEQLVDLFATPLTGTPADRINAYGEITRAAGEDRDATLEFALGMPTDASPAHRAARALLLGEATEGRPDLTDAVIGPLTTMAAAERDPAALALIGHALARLCDPRAVEPLLVLATHRDPDVRFAAAHGLGPSARVDAGRPAALAALIDLTRDPVAPIRDWATFGLAQTGDTGDDVTAALVERIDDPDLDTRAEAVMGLATRRDGRVVEPLIAILGGEEVGSLEVRAAGLLADARLFEPLRDWAAGRDARDDDPEYWELVEAAIRRCDPGAADAAERVEVALLTTVQASMAESGIEPFDVALAGEYPTTEVVLTRGDRQERHPIWNFDEGDPADPTTIDLAFAMNRLANIATWL